MLGGALVWVWLAPGLRLLPRGGALNLLMSVLTLHVLAWGAAGASHWALVAWRDKDQD